MCLLSACCANQSELTGCAEDLACEEAVCAAEQLLQQRLGQYLRGNCPANFCEFARKPAVQEPFWIVRTAVWSPDSAGMASAITTSFARRRASIPEDCSEVCGEEEAGL